MMMMITHIERENKKDFETKALRKRFLQTNANEACQLQLTFVFELLVSKSDICHPFSLLIFRV